MRTLGEERGYHGKFTCLSNKNIHRQLAFTIAGSFLHLLQSCLSSPPHTSLSQSRSFSKDSYLKESRRPEVQLRFTEWTCFQSGKLFILSMYAISFFFFYFGVSFVYFLVSYVFENVDHLWFSFFLNSYHLDASRRFPLGVSLLFYRYNKQILNLELFIWNSGWGQFWRVHVIYGRSWIVCPPCVRTTNAIP